MKSFSKHATLKKCIFAVGLITLIAQASIASAACHSFTIYTKNTQRSNTPDGPDGPVGDLTIASGFIYQTPTDGATPVGTFDFSAITTSDNNSTERRQVFIETSFDPSFTRKLNHPRRLCGTSKSAGNVNLASTNDISMTGVETYPLGGGVLTTPIMFGISSGTGLFVGADGSVRITYDPSTQFFTYVFTLLPR